MGSLFYIPSFAITTSDGSDAMNLRGSGEDEPYSPQGDVVITIVLSDKADIPLSKVVVEKPSSALTDIADLDISLSRGDSDNFEAFSYTKPEVSLGDYESETKPAPTHQSRARLLELLNKCGRRKS